MQNSTSNPLITVVISVKNRSGYLHDALQSLLNQTVDTWKCIVVDDYSDEDILAVVDYFNDSRIKYVKNPNKPGIASARNYGNSLADTLYIAVADSDDIVMPRRIEVTEQYLKANSDTDLFYGNIYCFTDGTYNIKISPMFSPFQRELLYTRDFVPHGTVCYRTDVINEIKYNESLTAAVDYDMVLNFADKRKVFGWTDEPLLFYRRHAEQISTHPETLAIQQDNTQKLIEKHRQYL